MIHHPAFQSVVLPLLLALLGIALVRAAAGARLAAWGGLVGLLVALAWLPGYEWPAPARVQKLPWIVLLGLGLVAFERVRPGSGQRALPAWVVAGLLWALAAFWLAGERVGSMPWAVAGAVVFGALLLWSMVSGRGEAAGRGVSGASVLALGSAGLVGLCALGGSLLLAQLALMLTVCAAVVTAWALLRPASGFAVSPALLLAFGLVWLAIAWTCLLAAPAAGAVVGVDVTRAALLAGLGLAFFAPWAVHRRPLGSSVSGSKAARWRTAGSLLLAAMPVLLALAWAYGVGTATMPETAADPDDPYLTPPTR